MTNRFFPEKRIRNARVVRPVSHKVFVWLAAIAIAGSVISCGFLVSARQHFESVTLGYEKESLREQRAALEEQLRKLELELSEASSPVEVGRRAKQAGLGRPEIKTGKIRRPASETAGR
jgi:hypothetical protein